MIPEILGFYGVMWFLATVVAMRTLALRTYIEGARFNGKKYCHSCIDRDFHYCSRHCDAGCWRADKGTEVAYGFDLGTVSLGAGIGVGWPIAVPIATAVWVAKKTIPKEADYQKIYKLEDELEMAYDRQ